MIPGPRLLLNRSPRLVGGHSGRVLADGCEMPLQNSTVLLGYINKCARRTLWISPLPQAQRAAYHNRDAS